MARWNLNSLEYLETHGISIFAFNNIYPEGKQGGVEIIQQGERLATNGDVRFHPAPGQWETLPELKKRTVDASNHRISVALSCSIHSLNYQVHTEPDGDSILIRVDLERPLPPGLVGKAGFNLELFPPAYFGKSFQLGSSFGIFPRQANGPVVKGSDGSMKIPPLAAGRTLHAAGEDPAKRLTIVSETADLQLIDGRLVAQNGWFVVRSLIPDGAAQNAIRWKITPSHDPTWKRPPMIAVSQVGYHPEQKKHAVIELEPGTLLDGETKLLKIDASNGLTPVFSASPVRWGKFLRYEYFHFDFSSIKEPGMYAIRCNDQTTHPFQIHPSVFQKDVWQPTLETFFPVQMCHMEVRDRYRIWHGACHLDDALQSPVSHQHFDGYVHGPETETRYKPFEHIPGLNVGGWHDAGDYDLAAGSQARTTWHLSLAREEFGIDTDQTTVDRENRRVILHEPDGIPDIIQQIFHGVENLLTGYRISGHSFCGIVESTLEQYVHLGDAMTMTDNLVYDSSLNENERKEQRSGRKDDRWAFTNRDTALEYQVATSLTAASRVLKNHKPELAEECLQTAVRVWDYEQGNPPKTHKSAYVPADREVQEVLATVELFLTTREKKYGKRLTELLPFICKSIDRTAWAISRTLHLIDDPNFRSSFEISLAEYRENLLKELGQNPFGVLYSHRIWGIGWNLQLFAVEQYYLNKSHPNLFDRENGLRVLNFILGTHPGNNLSFVSGVGARSMTVAYGTNRDDWSYTPGGVASGVALIRPDFPELKESYPYLWQQAEYVMHGAATYIFCVLAADRMLNGQGNGIVPVGTQR